MQHDADLFGTDLFGDVIHQAPSGPLAERFLVPPFTVLDARGGDWQERKRAWVGMGIKGEVGRTARSYNIAEWASSVDASKHDTDISVFDPMLCEVAYRWFCPDGGQVVDPFAGGAVRGVVAAMTNRRYWGCDIRREQVEANVSQWSVMAGRDVYAPEWVVGDALDMVQDAPSADFVFSCPPYGDLEVYSDDPRDLSNMEWHTFVAEYRRIILRSIGRLRDNRFACFVVGDFRDSKGFYRNFVSETIAAFEMCGARLYNEAILVTPTGTAAMRATKQFDASRKLCKTHQNVLVFCKGDPRKAASVASGRSDV